MFPRRRDAAPGTQPDLQTAAEGHADVRPALLSYRILTPNTVRSTERLGPRRADGAVQSSAAARAEERSPPSVPSRPRRAGVGSRDPSRRAQPRAAPLTPAEGRSWSRRPRGQRPVLPGAAARVPRCCQDTRPRGRRRAEQHRPPPLPQRPRVARTAQHRHGRAPARGCPHPAPHSRQLAAVSRSGRLSVDGWELADSPRQRRERRVLPLCLPQGQRSVPPNPGWKCALLSARFRLLLADIVPELVQHLCSRTPLSLRSLPTAVH